METIELEKALMQILPNVWRWSVFSEEKQLYFNGYVFDLHEAGVMVVDPPEASADTCAVIKAIGIPKIIALTNRDHERASHAFREAFQCPVACHVQDATLLEHMPEQTFADGDLLPGGFHVVHLPHQKSPGECALYWPQRGLLVVGDALIGAAYRTLGMLPVEKYADRAKAFQALKRLADIHPGGLDAILAGDGEPVIGHAQDVLEKFFVTFEP